MGGGRGREGECTTDDVTKRRIMSISTLVRGMDEVN